MEADAAANDVACLGGNEAPQSRRPGASIDRSIQLGAVTLYQAAPFEVQDGSGRGMYHGGVSGYDPLGPSPNEVLKAAAIGY